VKNSLYNPIYLFLLFFVSSLLLFGSMTAFFLFQESKTEIKILMAKELQAIEKMRRVANDEIKSVVSDLFYLSVHPKLRQMLENGNPVFRQGLAEDYKFFSSSSKRYDQIRFLDETGMEKIRVNLNQIEPTIISEHRLQNKSKRYYFTDTFALDPGRIFISPFDLNIEQGKIEQPIKPMIRFGTPVLDLSGQKRGIVLINYLGTNLLRNLEQEFSKQDDSLMLINSQGYWLKGQNPEDEWGFMYEERKDQSIVNRYPKVWEKILDQNEGQFSSDLGVFSFTTIWPLGNGMLSSTGSNVARQASKSVLSEEKYFWKLVSLVTHDMLTKIQITILYRWFPYLSVIFISAILLSLSLSLAITQRKQAMDAKLHEEKLNGVLEMAGAVCHELNQPLMSISGFSELLLEDLPDNHIQKENLGEIKKQAGYLGEITGRLMNITKYKTKRYLKRNIIDIEAASDDDQEEFKII